MSRCGERSLFPTPGSLREKARPAVAFEVENLDEAVAALKAAGVTIIEERIESPICSFARIADPDGNGITTHKRQAGVSVP